MARKTDPDHEPFRPSNSDHGLAFEAAWCASCNREKAHRRNPDARPCGILLRTYAYSDDEPEYPKEWRQDGPEGPRCTAWAPVTQRKSPVGPRHRKSDAIRDLFA